ncbi:hypothetical protein AAMO2058_001670000 [Amorphochlora amoebiformis]
MIEGGVLEDQGDSRVCVVYDSDMLSDLRKNLKTAMPGDHWLHAMAIKSAPLQFLLKEAVLDGFGLEAASYLEVKMAEEAGCPPDRIVFDSPAKTVNEIRYALSAGLLLNCNSMTELRRLQKAYPTVQVHPKARIGIRINPLIGAGSIANLSVSKKDSKFGVQDQNEILQAFEAFPALSALHVHTGSQGMELSQLAAGALVAVELAEKINKKCGHKRVSTIDIGGGLSANYDNFVTTPTFDQYASELKQTVPEIFSNSDVAIVTEFGRALVAKAGFVLTGVEYMMRGDPSKPVAITHAGADLFVRPCYDPKHFSHRFTAYDSNGVKRKGEDIKVDIAGPLCFAGDIIGREVNLPESLDEGDWIAVHDCGANTYALWSRHCSRQAPAVYGITRRTDNAKNESDGVEVVLMKEKEAESNVLAFWK